MADVKKYGSTKIVLGIVLVIIVMIILLCVSCCALSAITAPKETTSSTSVTPTSEPSIISEEIESSPTPTPSPEPTSTPTPEPTAVPKSTMDLLWEALDNSIKTRDGYDIGYETSSGFVTVTVSPKMYYDSARTVEAMYGDLVEYGLKAFDVPGVSEIEVTIQGDFQDNYGNKSVQTVCYVSMKKGEFKKYNWGELKYQPIYERMQRSASFHFIHPSIINSITLGDLVLRY